MYGCLLGYESIAAEMGDKELVELVKRIGYTEELVELVKRIGYTEGLPVVTDPGILSPRAFIDEVVTQRLPNPFIPDTPQRIATDTSQKIPCALWRDAQELHGLAHAGSLPRSRPYRWRWPDGCDICSAWTMRVATWPSAPTPCLNSCSRR